MLKYSAKKMNPDTFRAIIIGLICVIGRLQVKSQDIIPYQSKGCVQGNSPYLQRKYYDTRPGNIDVFIECQNMCRSHRASVFGVKKLDDTSIYVWCYCMDPNTRLTTVDMRGCWYQCQEQHCGGPRPISLYEDVNECEANTSLCQAGLECNNTIGGYRCGGCSDGFIPATHDPKQCNDIDECRTSTPCGRGSCTNTVGSYQCSCQPGYTLNSDNDDCTDVDECEMNDGDCDQLCANTEGGYVCECRPGYVLVGTYECQDIDECEENMSGCDFGCTNSEGSYRCLCQDGSPMTNGSCPAAPGEREMSGSAVAVSVVAVGQIVSVMCIVVMVMNILKF